MAVTAPALVILGNNDSAYRLLQKLQRLLPKTQLYMPEGQARHYCPSSCFPELLAGSLSLKEALLPLPAGVVPLANIGAQTPVINTQCDPQHISVLRLPEGRRRYFCLYQGEDVAQAQQALQSYGKLVVYGSSLKAVLYATACAQAGMQVHLVQGDKALVHRHFDEAASELIQGLLQSSGVSLISKKDAKALKWPALFTPFSDKSLGVVRARAQIKNEAWDALNAQYQLQDGGDWYELPEMMFDQMLTKLNQDQPISVPWSIPSLPHRVEIQDFAVHYAGSLQPEQGEECLTMSIPEQGVYRKIILSGDRVTGFLLAGDVSGSEALTDMLLTHRSVQDLRDELLFIGR